MTELQSMNITEDNISKLNSLFPEAFNENGIDFDVLKRISLLFKFKREIVS